MPANAPALTTLATGALAAMAEAIRVRRKALRISTTAAAEAACIAMASSVGT